MYCKSTRLKKSRSNCLKSGNAVTQHLSEKKRDVHVYVLPHTAATLAKRGWKIKHLLIPRFLSRMSAKIDQIWIIYIAVIAIWRWDIFGGHGVHTNSFSRVMRGGLFGTPWNVAKMITCGRSGTAVSSPSVQCNAFYVNNHWLSGRLSQLGLI